MVVIEEMMAFKYNTSIILSTFDLNLRIIMIQNELPANEPSGVDGMESLLHLLTVEVRFNIAV